MMFTFQINKVRPLLQHSLKAAKHRLLYGIKGTDVPGLLLVKDEGVYLMSNAEPGLMREDGKHHQVVYALGFGPDEYLAGDDFGELIKADWLERIFKTAEHKRRDCFSVMLTQTKLELSV